MKSLLISLSLATLSLAQACKSSPEIDPRNQYIGQYASVQNTTIAATNSIFGTLKSGTDNVLVTISKGNDSNELRLFIPPDVSLTATLDNSSLFIPPQAFSAKTATGTAYWLNYSGNGLLNNEKLSLNFSASASVSTANVRQVTTIAGTKK